MKRQVCEFDITDMLPIGMTLVVAGIGIAYGIDVMSDIKGDVEPCQNTSNFFNTTDITCRLSSTNTAIGGGTSPQYNASNDSIEAVGKIPEKMPMIATVIIAAIIIGILVRYLMVRFG